MIEILLIIYLLVFGTAIAVLSTALEEGRAARIGGLIIGLNHYLPAIYLMIV